MALSDLPTELQCAIIRYLDPVTLISVSQTNRHFRTLISPKCRHFLERLFAYEVLLEYGGMTPVFDMFDDVLHPLMEDPAWSKIRLACPRCRRLLHHRDFDNGTIRKLAYRKPPTAASVHELSLTTWQPSMSLVYPRKAEIEKARLRDKKIRRQYHLCLLDIRAICMFRGWEPEAHKLSNLKGCGMEGFEDMTKDQFDDLKKEGVSLILERNGRAIERERAGYKRLQRRCNECQLGRIPTTPGENHGDVIPIATCRELGYHLYLDRWFPELFDNLKTKRPDFNPVLYYVYDRQPTIRHIVTYMGRCARCARWKELRNFGIGPSHPRWEPFTTEALIVAWDGEVGRGADCNACFAGVHGREALGSVLVPRLQCLVDRELIGATKLLLNCFRPWRRMIGWLPEKYRKEAKSLFRDTPCLSQNWSIYRMTHEDVTMVKQRRAQWRDMERRIRDEEPEEVPDEWWVDGEDGEEVRWEWMVGFLNPTGREEEYEMWRAYHWYSNTKEQFEAAVAFWEWLVGVRAEVEERPEVLVEWALSSSDVL